MWADAALGLSVFYVLPTQDSRNIFVPNRINRLIRRVPFYADLIRSSVGSADSVLLKHIGEGVVRFGSSQSIQEFKEFPADCLYVDEYDQCDPAGVSYAFDRCKGSPFKFTHYLGNPTFPGAEFRHNIDWHYHNSDQKQLHYRCEHCDLVQYMTWWDHIVEPVKEDGVVVDYIPRDTTWVDEAGAPDMSPICSRCGGSLPRDRTLVGWLPTGNPNHPVSGYHLSRLAPLSDSIAELWGRFRPGIANVTALKTFVQSDLGEAFEGGVGNKLTEEIMARCMETYELPDPVYITGPCTMGVDVGNNLDVRISDYVLEEGEDGKRIVRRRLVYAGKVRHLSDLYLLVDQYRVSVAVIDAMPEARLSKDFQLKAHCKVWRAAYHPVEGSNPRAIRWDVNQGQHKLKDEKLVWCDRTEVMDTIYGCYLQRLVIEPTSFTGIMDGKYVAEHMAPTRLMDDETGRAYWVKCTDHQFHANIYDWLASQDPMGGFMILGSQAIVRGAKRHKSEFDPDSQPVQNLVQRLRKRASVKTWESVSG